MLRGAVGLGVAAFVGAPLAAEFALTELGRGSADSLTSELDEAAAGSEVLAVLREPDAAAVAFGAAGLGAAGLAVAVLAAAG